MDSTTPDSHNTFQLPAYLGRQLMFFLIRAFVFTMIYGIFVLLFLHSVRVYCSREQCRKSHHWMFMVTTITFVLTTINEAVTVIDISLFTHSAFVEGQSPSSLVRHYGVYVSLAKPETSILWFDAFQIFISDCIIVWRAYVLSPHKRWLIAFSLFLLLCSVALMLSFLLRLAVGVTVDREAILIILSVGLSLATNIVATALIGHVYWVHRKDMSLGLGAHRATRAERVLALLVESGVLFCILQSIVLICLLVPYPEEGTLRSYYLNAIVGSTYYGLSAIYPTAMVALVNSHHTFDRMCSINTFPQSSSHDRGRNSAATSHGIEFARPTTSPTNTMENHEPVMNADKETSRI